jgi:hypothetical protein
MLLGKALKKLILIAHRLTTINEKCRGVVRGKDYELATLFYDSQVSLYRRVKWSITGGLCRAFFGG